MFVLGTAGHVDHGKSTLIESLTGQPADRLAEEKRRAMTIEPNFVYYTSPRYQQVGITDVPGHNRFVRNMIVGAANIDAALFVVACDDGWMPQSQEHLEILQGLGVKHALAVITKTDLVSPERVNDVAADVGQRLQPAFGDTSVVSYHSHDFASLERVKQGIERLLATLPPPMDRQVPRIWVDRVFSPRGMGVVVTGTLTEGAVHTGMRLRLVPKNIECEIRAIHSYQKPVTRIEPAHRVAVQLSQLKLSDVTRGDLLTGLPSPPNRTCFDARILWHGPLPTRPTRLSLCLGTWHGYGYFIPLTDSLFRIKCPPLAVRFNDPFVVRSAGHEQLLGVGNVIDPNPVTRHRRAVELLHGVHTAGDYVALCLQKERIVHQRALTEQTDLTPSQIEHCTQSLFDLNGAWVERGFWDQSLMEFEKRLEWSTQDIRALGLPQQMTQALLDQLVQTGNLEKRAYGYVSATQPAAIPFEGRFQGAPVRRADLTHGERASETMLSRGISDGTLIAMGDHILDQTSYEKLVSLVVAFLQKNNEASTRELKSVLKLSRNHAVLVLERMDRDRITYFKDGIRRLSALNTATHRRA